jgi:hypothetical protein
MLGDYELPTMPATNITSTCEGLDAADVQRAAEFMASVIHAFQTADPSALASLDHAGGDPRGQKNSYDFNQSLMKRGDKVRAWTARPYTEPDWEVMSYLRHHPSPSVWIDVTLNNGEGDYPICFVCSPDAEGRLRTCYYVDR